MARNHIAEQAYTASVAHGLNRVSRKFLANRDTWGEPRAGDSILPRNLVSRSCGDALSANTHAAPAANTKDSLHCAITCVAIEPCFPHDRKQQNAWTDAHLRQAGARQRQGQSCCCWSSSTPRSPPRQLCRPACTCKQVGNGAKWRSDTPCSSQGVCWPRHPPLLLRPLLTMQPRVCLSGSAAAGSERCRPRQPSARAAAMQQPTRCSKRFASCGRPAAPAAEEAAGQSWCRLLLTSTTF